MYSDSRKSANSMKLTGCLCNVLKLITPKHLSFLLFLLSTLIKHSRCWRGKKIESSETIAGQTPDGSNDFKKANSASWGGKDLPNIGEAESCFN